MTELSPEAKKLFEAARQAYSPSAQRVDALQAALQARIAAEAAAAASSGALSASGAAKLGLAVKAAIAVGVATAVVVGASLWQGSGEPSAPSAASPAPKEPAAPSVGPSAPRLAAPAASPAVEPAPRAVEPAQPLVEPVRRASAAQRPVTVRRASRAAAIAQPTEPSSPARATRADAGSAVARAAQADEPRAELAPHEPEPASEPESESESEAPTVVTRDTLDSELRLLRAARAALDAGAAARALVILEAHAERHPRGTLAQERLATRALALCALGRASAARSVVRELSRLSPGSPHLVRLRASCAWPAER